MRYLKFILLNIVYFLVIITVFSRFTGKNEISAVQENKYFDQFYGAEIQQDARNTIDYTFRWARKNAMIYLIRQPYDDGLNIMTVTATTITENQFVTIEISGQPVAHYPVELHVFRHYRSLVRLNTQPFNFFDTLMFKNKKHTDIDREIAFAVNNVVFKPIAGPNNPTGVMIFYFALVVLFGTWIYRQYALHIVVGVYGLLSVILLGIWWWGTDVLLFGLTHLSLVWFLGGMGINGVVIYYLYRYFAVVQDNVKNGLGWVDQRLAPVRQYGAPMLIGMRWLWQRPIILYSITVVLYFGGWIWGPQVISPISTKVIANIPITDANYDNSAGFFSDYAWLVAEEHMLMNVSRSTWLSTWSDMTQLGRPLAQLPVLNITYVITWVLRIWVDNPFVLFTVNFVLYAYLAGVFALLYVRRLLQHTGLALLAAYLISASPFFIFWNTYLLFIATTCWGLALFYGFKWLRDTPNWKPAMLLTFAVYSLLCLGYQQMIIHLAYMLVGYFLYLLWQLRGNRQQLWLFIGYASGAMVVGAMMAMPVYLDLIQTVLLATERQKTGAEYFYSVMVDVKTMESLFLVGLTYILKEMFEPSTNFISGLYPYRGGYTTLFVFTLMMIGAIWRWRDTWGWSVWVVIAVIFSFSRDAFIFGYTQLHLPLLSRAVMFWGVGQQIPEMILAVYGMHVLISEPAIKTAKILIGAVGISTQLILGAVIITLVRDTNFQWKFNDSNQFVVFSLIVVIGMLVIALVPSSRIKWMIVFGVLFLRMILLLQPMFVMQPLHEISVTSSSTEIIRHTLQPGERMAMVDDFTKESYRLPQLTQNITPFVANYNAVLNIPQIGTYNPLLPKHYVALMKRFGVRNKRYNPRVTKIALPMPENDQWMANIRTIVSKNTLNDPKLTLTARTDGLIPFYVYTTPSTMGCCLQVPLSDVRIDATAQEINYWIDTPKAATNRQLQKSENQGDRFVVPVTESAKESIIVFSQIFHPQWYARVRTATGWQDATTVVVNASYQGVRVPVGTKEVVMEFRPWVFWSIIPNLFWLGCALVLFGRWMWSYMPIQSFVQQLRKRVTL